MFDDMKSYALGAHAWFWPEGDPFTLLAPGGIAGVNALPDATDPGWALRNIGDIESFEDGKKVETTETRKPNPGFLARKEVITWFQAAEHKFVTNSMSRLAMGIFRGTSADLTAGDFRPMSDVPPNGWLRIQKYDHKNNLIVTTAIWVRADVSGGIKGGNGEVIKPEFTIMGLESDLNTEEFF